MIHILHNSLIGKREIRLHASPPLICLIIGSPFTTVQIIVPFEPLYELEVILILGLRQLFNLKSI